MKVSVSLSIEKAVVEAARIEASRNGRSLSNYVELLMRDANNLGCDHKWEIDYAKDLIKCVKCGEENNG